MSRLIDADALIDKTDDRYSLGEIGRRERDDIVNAVEFAPTIEERKTEWIPCGERLPEYGCPVLWCNENGSVFVSAITVKTDHGWAIGKRHRMCEVIAWMPLPEPYRGEGE